MASEALDEFKDIRFAGAAHQESYVVARNLALAGIEKQLFDLLVKESQVLTHQGCQQEGLPRDRMHPFCGEHAVGPSRAVRRPLAP